MTSEFIAHELLDSFQAVGCFLKRAKTVEEAKEAQRLPESWELGSRNRPEGFALRSQRPKPLSRGLAWRSASSRFSDASVQALARGSPISGQPAKLTGGGGIWSSPRWKESTTLRAPLASESPRSTEGTTSRTTINRVTSTAAVMRRPPRPVCNLL